MFSGIALIRPVFERIFRYERELAESERRIAYERRLKGSFEEKEVLLRELHQRTKNCMQVICSLLDLGLAQCKYPEIAEEVREIESRIRSMSLVHERLDNSEDLSRIDLADYIMPRLSERSIPRG